MSRQKLPSATTASLVDSQVLKFVSRAEQLRLRGQRNYSRYMFIVKGFVDADGPERAQWRKRTLRNLSRTLSGTNVRAVFPVAQLFFGGDSSMTMHRFRNTRHRQTRTSGDKVASTRILPKPLERDLPGTRAAIHTDAVCDGRGASAVRVHDEDLHIEAGAGSRGHEVDVTSVR